VTEQSYANHRKRAPLWLAAATTAMLGFLLVVLFFARQPSVVTAGLVLMGFALLCTVMMVRGYAIRLQNRIIRLEMQVRLARLGRERDLDRLSVPQVIALRFASDAELPALIDRALGESLTPDQIKRAVTAWQADHLRT
jgi:predicted lysophospholipase L1 biosynthesis ABC-type transport system permease subunit